MRFTIHIENSDFAIGQANKTNNLARVINKLHSQGITDIQQLNNGDLSVEYEPDDLRNTGPDQYRTVSNNDSINFLDIKQVMRSSPHVKFNKKGQWYVKVPVHSRSKMMLNPYQAPELQNTHMRTVGENSNPSSWIEINRYGTYNKLKQKGQLNNVDPFKAQAQLQNVLGTDGEVELGGQYSFENLQNEDIDQQELRELQKEDVEQNNGADLKKQTLGYIQRQMEPDNQPAQTDDQSLNERNIPGFSFNPAQQAIENQLNHTNADTGLNDIPLPPSDLFNNPPSR